MLCLKCVKTGRKKLLSAEQWNMLSSVMHSGEHLRHYWDTWGKGKQIRKTLITNYIFIFIIIWRDTMIKSITYHKTMMILSWWGCTVSGNNLNFENPSNMWSDDKSVSRKAYQQLSSCQSRCVLSFSGAYVSSVTLAILVGLLIVCHPPGSICWSPSFPEPCVPALHPAPASLTCTALFPPLHSYHPTNIISLNLLKLLRAII